MGRKHGSFSKHEKQKKTSNEIRCEDMVIELDTTANYLTMLRCNRHVIFGVNELHPPQQIIVDIPSKEYYMNISVWIETSTFALDHINFNLVQAQPLRNLQKCLTRRNINTPSSIRCCDYVTTLSVKKKHRCKVVIIWILVSGNLISPKLHKRR